MDNNINHYLPKIVAKYLADQYGDQLEEMPLSTKLLLIHVLSGGLHELETCPYPINYSFVDYCHGKGMADDLLDGVLPLLEQFDKYDSSTVQAILLVLALSM